MSVSFVVRRTSAFRSPAKRNSAILSQSFVTRAHTSSRPSQAAVPPLDSGFSNAVSFCKKIARQPKFLASSTSVGRSPITKLPARSYSGLFRYFVNIPVRGFRVGAISSGMLRSMKISSNVIPSPSSVFIIRLCAGQKVSSGKDAVPNPS